ncbi:MAG: hypothetical protein QOE19_2325 [Actinomycetota bacterium]|nr:hypothetical protein [Actinomycetota bacterium]
MNATGIVILLVLIILAAVAVAVILAAKRRKRDQLQDRFGPEYDRAVDQHGSRKEAESHLADVADRRDALEITDLSPEQRADFRDRWVVVQTAFVDQPSRAVQDADRLVASLMRERGYPVDDFDTKVDMVAVDHPQVAEHYRAAHSVAGRTDRGSEGSTTEEQRQAFVHYRALFAELLDDGDHGRHAGSETGPAARDVDLNDRNRSDARPNKE